MPEIGDLREGLKLLEKLGRRYKCQCTHCGNVTTIGSQKFGYTKSCGCLKHRFGKNSAVFTGYEDMPGTLWDRIIRNAKSRNLEITVSKKDLWELFVEQNRKCKISGVELNFVVTRKQHNSTTASLDRIDSTKGYVKDNIQWVHKNINKIKMDLSTDVFIDWCRKVTEFNDKSS